MSADTLDQRLREAFHADDDWIPDVSLADVRSEARRTTARRRTALAAAAAVVLVGGAAVAVTRGGADDGADPVAPSPSPHELSRRPAGRRGELGLGATHRGAGPVGP